MSERKSKALLHTTLDDKYTLENGRVFLSGTQALVRLPIMQQRRDAAAGINSAGYISGYRGSPLGTYDRELWRAQRFLEDRSIVFQPGVNEDLAATAIWGTQQVNLFPGAQHDGVFSIWYGKGPGVDRSGDVFKHANLAGTSQYGGVLVAFGDDHGAKSSTLAHQSEQSLVAAMIPILNPATIEDILEFGLYGWAMSRYAGTWVGLKCVNETMESTASTELQCINSSIKLPDDVTPSPDGVHIRMGFEPIQAEQRLIRHKLPLAVAFARANRIDKTVFAGNKKRLGIVSAGKAYLDVRQALERLGIDKQRAEQLGIGLYKVGLTWPIEPEGMKTFATGFDALLFVEEKRPLIEEQAAALLYDLDSAIRPSILGKRDEDGGPLLASDGLLDVEQVAQVIATRLERLSNIDGQLRVHLDQSNSAGSGLSKVDVGVKRLPYFCSGCPHSTSTKVPEGSQAMAGIGCSFMAVWMDRDTVTSVQMGGEGANWNGIAPFTNTSHIFQNIGDGTYFHSGLMAIRAAVAANVNITYKILFNDAVAMTGGQPVDGQLSVAQITRQVSAEGAKKIVVVTDEPDKYSSRAGFADNVTIYHRRELEDVQRQLRETDGTTILIYDQTCAAEKRRRRKRSTYPDPPKRVFINDAVCEGCGDCSKKSNCVSLLPLSTEFGRKRQVDQSSCNKDYSCVDGFCPSFVTVHGGRLRKSEPVSQSDSLFHSLPNPDLPSLSTPYNILITGIGGTGVITIGALLGMAAHLEDKACSVFDMTGMAQKNGAVTSHLRIATNPRNLHAVRIGHAQTHLLLGCDIVVSATNDVLQTVEANTSKAIINSHMVPTGDFQLHGDMDFQSESLSDAICEAVGEGNVDFIDASGLATTIMGDKILTNLFMVGYAYQNGLLPLEHAAIERAIELNNIEVESNKRAFNWGRLASHDLDAFMAFIKAIGSNSQGTLSLPERSVEDISNRRVKYLTEYQNREYAKRYSNFVEMVRLVEHEKINDSSELSSAVAKSLFKLMAYKDEYEVARLYTSGEFETKLHAQFEGQFKLRFYLAPPFLSSRNSVTGEVKKREFGPWIFWVFKYLAKLKWLRGTMFDVFSYTSERKMERQLIDVYQTTIREVLVNLNTSNYSLAVEIANLPQEIRGFGHVKERNLLRARKHEADLLSKFNDASVNEIAQEIVG
tara:strand:- start:9786 stop:13298 length:3513 start_codon:yes stop_codon:yes gene_type:complete